MIFINKEKYKNYFGIYKIKNCKNHKVYIGQTGDRFIERYWHHQWKLNNKSHDNLHLQRAWDKYGSDNFQFSVITVCTNKTELDNLEIKYINQYKDKKLSYNMSNGGQGKSYPMSEHAKKIVGSKNRLHMLGKKHTMETRKKMSKARKGKIPYKKAYVINQEIAFNLKNDLINKIPYKILYKKYNINYKTINGLISNNNWRSVYVKGWDEFRASRLKPLNKQIADDIRESFKDGSTKQELMSKFQRSERTIRDILKNRIYID